MTEETKSLITNNLIIGIVGSVIGGLIVYYLLKSKLQQSVTLQSSSTIENRLLSIEQRFQQSSSFPVTTLTENTLYKNNE